VARSGEGDAPAVEDRPFVHTPRVGERRSTPGGWATTVHETGSPLTRIVVPAIDVSTPVLSGTSPAALGAGPGHHRATPRVDSLPAGGHLAERGEAAV
jgi:sortase (surface protein transpeptidase)